MPLRFVHAPSAVQAAASAIGGSQSAPGRGHLEPFTVSAFTLPLALFTQQILLFGLPQVLLASHLRIGFLHVSGSVPSFTAAFSTVLAHLTYAPWESAAVQSHAADTRARM